ncbi:MAG: cobalamin B12-binding domain-containing protein, partial [Desulfobulbaceae bacterium]|nr:cobalamin B12-binding domain-containing protein [Desulfobulbaceae bacterium]
MKVTFLYSDNCIGNRNKFNIGIASLAAVLKENGFDTSLIHIWQDIDKSVLCDIIQEHNPDILAFSYMGLTFEEIKKFVRWTNDIPIPKIHG